jgi:hypothetical protein
MLSIWTKRRTFEDTSPMTQAMGGNVDFEVPTEPLPLMPLDADLDLLARGVDSSGRKDA